MLSLLVRSLRDDSLNSVPSEPPPDARVTVSLVSGDSGRAVATANPEGVHERFKTRRFVLLARRDFRGKGHASAVSNQVQLAAESASRAAQTVVLGLLAAPFLPPPAAARLARIEDPSTHQRSQSILPSASRRICNRSRTWSKNPSRRHLRNRSYTVCQAPNRSGRSRQGAPVRRTQKIAFRMSRWFFHCRPRCPWLAGSRSLTNSHSWSLSSYRRIRAVSRSWPSFLPGFYLWYRHFDHLSDRA